MIPPLSNLSLNECVNDATWVFNLLADWKSDHLVQFLNLQLEVRSLFFGKRSNSPLKSRSSTCNKGDSRGFKQEEHEYSNSINESASTMDGTGMSQFVWGLWGPKINVFVTKLGPQYASIYRGTSKFVTLEVQFFRMGF